MSPNADSAIFIDSNILIYSGFSSASLPAETRRRLQELESSGAALWISRQVLREFLAVATRPDMVTPPPTSATLSDLIGQFENVFRVADEDAPVTTLLIGLVESLKIQGKQIHDANTVATMKRHQIQRLFTHNVADFARYSQDVELVALIP
jgi:predicted nucleic acid-binding protein